MAFIELNSVFKYLPHQMQKTLLKRESVELRVVRASNCDGCYFKEGKKCTKPATAFSCTSVGRVDKISVKFIVNTVHTKQDIPVRRDVMQKHKRLSIKDIEDMASTFQDIPDGIIEAMEE